MLVNYLHFILCLNFFFKAKTSFILLNGTISKSNYLNVCSSIIKDNIECDVNKRFRSFDGSCNNLKLSWLGKSNTPYKRYCETSYQNNKDEPRSLSKSGKQLPNPRMISRSMFSDNKIVDQRITHLVAFFGQFLAHDLTSSPIISKDKNGKSLTCDCQNEHEDCLSIQIPENETIMKMSCMKLTRSRSSFPTFDCQLGYREQLNQLSSFIDGTQIYGLDEKRSKALRLLQGGLLKSNEGINSRSFLPQTMDPQCTEQFEEKLCFAAGESRLNENLALVALQTLFNREHNRIANELAIINSQWSDERLYEETRRILIALYQHITYNEYISIVIGKTIAKKFGLLPNGVTDYNSRVNPSISNEFASSAFRFGHTLVRNTFGRFNENNQQIASKINLSETIFRPVEAYNKQAGGIDSLFLSLINEPSSAFDTNFPDHLQNHLFERSNSALDLAAVNIIRGRDHGIPAYNIIRASCGFKRAQSFQDLNDFIPEEKINELSFIYDNVDDIDFYVGGLSESADEGSLVGPTFACIIANQFKDLKRGDRFYYENGPSVISFSKNQLNEIRKASMSSLICNNFDLNNIQPNAFLQPLSPLKYLTKIKRSGWFRDHGNDKRILVSLGPFIDSRIKGNLLYFEAIKS